MASRSLSKVQSAKSEIESSTPSTKGRLSAVQLDVTDSASISQAAQFVETKFGLLDALVNNAAVGNCDPDPKTRFQACMDTNLIGPVVTSSIFRPLLLKSSNPYSIYVSSGAGSFGRTADTTRVKLPMPPNGNAYQASKAALNMVALNEWNEVQEKGIGLKVFAMCPGFVVSNLRGTDEEARTGWGRAGDPSASGETLLRILKGGRDGDVGKLVWEDGVYPW